jgi:RND family efflux transporter MFP subunit
MDSGKMFDNREIARVETSAHKAGETRKPSTLIRLMKVLLFLALMMAAVGGVVFWGINARIKTASGVSRETLEMAVPTVSVIQARRGAPADEVVLPGNIQAFTDAPIYARANGYLKQWHADIGARVKAGELLAEIETPEIDKQLDQSRADLATAEANYRLSESTATRWQNLLKTDSVSKQETDEKLGDFTAKKAIVDSVRSNVRRLEDLQSFQKIYAPFDGVITARNTDVGQLIGAGSSGQAKELFHLASTSKLRVYVSVPQLYSRSAVPGVAAELTLAEFPGRHFSGKLVRTAEAIDTASRTLLAEVDVDNSDGRLLPGAFAEVHLKLPAKTGSFVLPVNTLMFRSEGLRVGVVRDNRAELVPIIMGRDYGTEVEILSGITAKDSVIVNPPDSLTSGTVVRVAPATARAGSK